ncbi:MAG: hydantoinase B/oxoprolinase family protein [Solirubrobacterales bacterium]
MDPITAQVVQGRLNQIALEMSRKLIRMGFSIIIKESEDIGAALTDKDGWQLCEADTTPFQMGAIPWYVQGVLKTVEERGDTIRPGDVFIHNDPYRGASHSPDIGFFAPIFRDDELIGWSCTTAHHLEIGCSKPGTSVIDAVDDWACGLRLRALKIRSEGEDNAVLWEMIEDNVRIPDIVVGDMQAQIAACELGARRLLSLIDEVGKDEVFATQKWFEDYSERVLRAEIAKVPDGEYFAEGFADGFDERDDPASKNLRFAVTLRIKGDSIEVDLTGTSPQLDDLPLNMPLQGTVMCAIFTVVRSVLIDTWDHEAVPQNRGLMRPIEVIAPKGTMVNPTFPAPTIARVLPALTLADTLVKAFSEVVPELCCAGTGALAVLSYSGVVDEKYWIHMDIHEGSYGATWGRDGMDAVDTLFANTRCAPIEEIETEFPLRCVQWQLNANPPGHGEFRGGKGGVREYRYLSDGFFSSEADGQLHAPWGMDGGLSGAPSEMALDFEDPDRRERLSSKQPGRVIPKGRVLRIVSPNGGGVGSPLARDPQRVLDDVLDDLITADEAREIYGVAVDVEAQAVRGDETAELRKAAG